MRIKSLNIEYSKVGNYLFKGSTIQGLILVLMEYATETVNIITVPVL